MTTFKIRCTTCRKMRTLTEDELKKASQFGCAISACCNAVATVESITIDGKPLKDDRRLVNFRRAKK